VSDTPRFVGQSNAYDIPNNIIYLGSLEYAWDVGDSLVGWTLGGTTVPTIAVDGRMRLYDNINAADQSSSAYITIPNTLGKLFMILHVKFTRMIDDTSTDDYALYFSLNLSGASTGIAHRYRPGVSNYLVYADSTGLGNLVSFAFVPVAGQEYALDVVVSPSEVILFIDNVRRASVPLSSKGSSQMSNHPRQQFLSYNKRAFFWVRHDAGEVSHYRLRDIRVSEYRGKNPV